MRIAICDDSLEYIKTIESYFDEIKKNNKNLDYDIFENGTELASIYKSEGADYDAIFLDMEMKDMNGIDVANVIRKYDKCVIIVFITSFKKYMQKSFECAPFRFLIKPVFYDDIQCVINDINLKLQEDIKTLVFETNRIHTRLYCDDILYFESHGHNVWINTINEKYQIIKSLSELIDILGSNMFYRTHKSFIVNFKHVKEIHEREVVLYNTDVRIPLSRTYKKQFVRGFINFKERKFMI